MAVPIVLTGKYQKTRHNHLINGGINNMNYREVIKGDNTMDTIFIRSLRQFEKGNPTRHLYKIPSKNGYRKVYMPYGEKGKGYYYQEENSQNG